MTEKQIGNESQQIQQELGRVERSIQRAQASPTPFAAVGRVVMLGAQLWGKMRSNTAAIRTARALNAYEPDERGR